MKEHTGWKPVPQIPSHDKRHPLIFTNARALVRKISHVPDNAVLDFELGWRCAHINDLLRRGHELRKIQRPVIERTRQMEAIFIHSADLRNGGMRFIACQHGAVPGLTEKQLSGNMAK
jgi:hypothetical protein